LCVCGVLCMLCVCVCASLFAYYQHVEKYPNTLLGVCVCVCVCMYVWCVCVCVCVMCMSGVYGVCVCGMCEYMFNGGWCVWCGDVQCEDLSSEPSIHKTSQARVHTFE